MTWARAYIKEGVLWMDVGRGEVVKLPAAVRDAVVGRDDARVAVHGGRHGHLARHADGALPVEPRGRRLRRRLRRDGRALAGARLQGARPRAPAHERAESRSTSASTSAPASGARGSLRRGAARCTGCGVIADPKCIVRRADFVEQSSDDIWRAAARPSAARSTQARARAGGGPGHRLRRDVLARRARRGRPARHREPNGPRRAERHRLDGPPRHRSGAPHQRDASRSASLRGRRHLARDADAEAALAEGECSAARGRAPGASSICPTSSCYRATGNDVRSLCTHRVQVDVPRPCEGGWDAGVLPLDWPRRARRRRVHAHRHERAADGRAGGTSHGRGGARARARGGHPVSVSHHRRARGRPRPSGRGDRRSRPTRTSSASVSRSSAGRRRATWPSRASRASSRACGVRTSPRWSPACG